MWIDESTCWVMVARYSHLGICIIEMLNGRLLITESPSNGAIVLMPFVCTKAFSSSTAVEDTLRFSSISICVYLPTLKPRFSQQHSTQRSITHELQIWFRTSISLAEHFSRVRWSRGPHTLSSYPLLLLYLTSPFNLNTLEKIIYGFFFFFFCISGSKC